MVSYTSIAQVGMGTTTPNPSAALDLTSTTKGFLPPRMSLDQLNAIVAPTEGLMAYCTDCATAGIYYFNGVSFANMLDNLAGLPIGEVESSTGKIWMDKNLGASRVAISSDDYLSYGNLYQWGRNSDGHEIIVRELNFMSNASLPATGSSSTSTQQLGSTEGSADFIIASDDWLSIGDNLR